MALRLTRPSSLIFVLSLTHLLLQTLSQPPPPAAGPVNVTGILTAGGQFTSFLRLLNQTQVLSQIPNQLNNSNQGMTLFAPTDNAFLNLSSGTLNVLSDQQKVQLVLYHLLPQYYSLADLVTVSNPVRTQATGNNGRPFGLNFTGQANQVNVSTGVVQTQVNNPLRQQFPFAVYQVDKVLLPLEFSEAPPPTGSSSPPAGNRNGTRGSNSPTVVADGPSAPAGNGAGTVVEMGLGLIVGVVLSCMAFL